MRKIKKYFLFKEQFPWPILRSVSLLLIFASAICGFYLYENIIIKLAQDYFDLWPLILYILFISLAFTWVIKLIPFVPNFSLVSLSRNRINYYKLLFVSLLFFAINLAYIYSIYEINIISDVHIFLVQEFLLLGLIFIFLVIIAFIFCWIGVYKDNDYILNDPADGNIGDLDYISNLKSLGCALSLLIIIPWIKNYIYTPYIYAPYIYGYILLFLIGILFIISIMILSILIIDYYRSKNTEIKYNIILDRLLPLYIISLPSLAILLKIGGFNLLNLSLITLIYIALTAQVFIVGPIIYFWAQIRQWNNGFVHNWKSPLLYKYLAIAIIYPLVWVLYFSLARYLRLGKTLEIYTLIDTFNIDVLGVLIATSGWWIYLLLYCMTYLGGIRAFIWRETSCLLYSMHINLIQVKIYFYLAEKIFKGLRLFFAFCIHGYVDLKMNKYKRVIHYIIFNHYAVIVGVIIFIFVELFITKKLHYSFYVLFYLPIIRAIYWSSVEFISSRFPKDVSFSDYLFERWSNPHYPYLFWFNAEDPMLWYGVESKNIPLSYVNEYEKCCKYYIKVFIDRKPRLRTRVYGYRLDVISKPFSITRTYCYVTRPWFTRFKAEFQSSGMRWVHTSSTAQAAKNIVLHPIVYNPLYLQKTCTSGQAHVYKTLAFYDQNI